MGGRRATAAKVGMRRLQERCAVLVVDDSLRSSVGGTAGTTTRATHITVYARLFPAPLLRVALDAYALQVLVLPQRISELLVRLQQRGEQQLLLRRFKMRLARV